MYERNAIVLERYFNQMFGYNMTNNIKTNFTDYSELVECLDKYKDIEEEEDSIIQDYDLIANKIRDIQKKQETLSKKNLKYRGEREELFQNIDEDAEEIKRKFDNINSNIEQINEQIKQNADEFIEAISEFNEKSSIRATCGRSRKNIENEYNQKLNKILDDYKNIDIDIAKKAKQFVDTPTEDIEKELKEKIQKNGSKEKIPFNMDVITKAITLCVDIQKRETEILANVYEKTNKLFTEIKNNTTKGDRHRKIIKDSKSKMAFVTALKEYLVQFLDNERLTAVNGEEEHNKLMEEACKNLEEDLIQINNLYTLLLKEISKKVNKKSYAELYNIEYLQDLEKKSEEFEKQIKKLNLPVTIINPNYWRIEGMKKIYDVFSKTVTEEYGRDLSEYIPEPEETIEESPEFEDDWDDDVEDEEPKEVKKETPKTKAKRKIKNVTQESDDPKSEIDKKIDMILGFDGQSETQNDDWEDDEDDDFEDEDEETGNDENDVYYDIWGNDISDDDDEDEENNDDIENDFDDDFGDDEEDEVDDEDDTTEDDDDFDDDDWDDEEDDEEDDRKAHHEENWEDEFVNVKEKSKKKKGFFGKFRK